MSSCRKHQHKCPVCDTTFSRQHDLRRHHMKFHSSNQMDTNEEGYVLKHPFTLLVSGPTACGKSQLISQILQGPSIHPTPQRIIWLYKRWQPLYDTLLETVCPKIEFIKGIPSNLENDEFIDPQMCNIIVLDDLMSTCSKDRRINDLYTEGSHHRNLSVISISQNLYFNKDPTQRRNCHYLALFNHPIDKQQVMTLARQMRPNDPQSVMRSFHEATSKPYGYLFVDLKQFTPEHKRLHQSPFSKQGDGSEIPEKEETFFDDKTTPENQSGCGLVSTDSPPWAKIQSGLGSWSCENCGILFATDRDRENHEIHHCMEEEDDNEDDVNEEDYDEFNSVQLAVWRQLFKNSLLQDWESDINKKAKELVEQGYNTKDAKDISINHFLPHLRKDLRQRYGQLLLNMTKLKGDRVHREVMKTIYTYRDEYDMGLEEAIKQAIKMRKHLIDEELLPGYDVSDDGKDVIEDT